MAQGRNKTPLVGWHPSAGLVTLLDSEVERRGGGRGVRSAILEEALARYLGYRPEVTTGQDEVTTAPVPAVAFVVAEDEQPKVKAAARTKCEHRINIGAYCRICGKIKER